MKQRGRALRSTPPSPARADGEGFERGGRRRRRRRRGRGGQFRGDGERAPDDARGEGEARYASSADDEHGEPAEAGEPERLAADPGEYEARPFEGDDRERDLEREPERDADREADSEREGDWEGEPAAERDTEGEPAAEREGSDGARRDESRRRRGRRGRRRRGRGRFGEGEREGGERADVSESREDRPPGEFAAGGEVTSEAHGAADAGPDAPRDVVEEDAVDHEVDATLAEHEEERERPAASEPVEVPPPRARRSRAAIVVRDEAESILAALVLARDRRTIVSFRVLPQDQLMNFFKGPGTDLPDNVDLLVVGFTAQPRPKEVLDTAELFRGRLQWFDHHDWAIEDVERLRAALGRDSILIASEAASPLAAVTDVTERRSRFTDKLVDLSARRLSETDMQKWGYRVIQLIQRMAAAPGEHRAEIVSVLAGKPTDLPSAAGVYGAETQWVEEHDPRIVHFGEYQLAVCQVPRDLDPGEVGRRVRLRTGARLSLAAREGDDLVVLASNDEKRPLNVMSLLDAVGGELSFVRPKTGGDRVGRARVDELDRRPERIEELIGGIVRHRSILYG